MPLVMQLRSYLKKPTVFVLAWSLAACAAEATKPNEGSVLAFNNNVTGTAGMTTAFSTSGTGQACSPDTHATVRQQNRYVDVVTNRGKIFVFETAGATWPSTGKALEAVKYYANGPCVGQPKGACMFETHAFANINGKTLEMVTEGGQLWTFDDGKVLEAGTPISALERYRDACPTRDAACRFESRVFLEMENRLVESVTVNGRLYQYYLDGTRLPGNGTDLTAIPHYALGPCAGRGPGACRIDTRTYGVVGNDLVETVTAGGAAWRWSATGNEPLPVLVAGSPIPSTSPYNLGPCN